MSRIPEKVSLKIINFKNYYQENRFKDSHKYLKVDFELMDKLLQDGGLDAIEMIIFMRLILIAFRQRSSLEGKLKGISTAQFLPFIHLSNRKRSLKGALESLHTKDYIQLDRDSLIQFNLREHVREEEGLAYGLESPAPQKEKEESFDVSKYLSEIAKSIN